MKNILIGAIMLLGLGYGGAKFYLHYKVSESMDTAVLVMSPYVNLTYGVSAPPSRGNSLSTMYGRNLLDSVTMLLLGAWASTLRIF